MHALFLAALLAAEPSNALQRFEITVDGVAREALVHLPASATPEKPAPLIFAFHGHGGTMRNAARQFHLETLWPEAAVVYMQGLKTVTARDPKGEKPGWQNRPGLNDDRDLKAVDAMLKAVREKTPIDDRRIYATGHSNGAGFTYCLWGARPNLLAAIAPSSANPPLLEKRQPIPAIHFSGKQDQIVPFQGQVRTVESLRKINGCDEQGRSWAPGCTLYPSAAGTPVVWMTYDGGHNFEKTAPELMVRFFREHSKPARDEPIPGEKTQPTDSAKSRAP